MFRSYPFPSNLITKLSSVNICSWTLVLLQNDVLHLMKLLLSCNTIERQYDNRSFLNKCFISLWSLKSFPFGGPFVRYSAPIIWLLLRPIGSWKVPLATTAKLRLFPFLTYICNLKICLSLQRNKSKWFSKNSSKIVTIR